MGWWTRSSMETQEWFFSKQDEALYNHSESGWHRHAPIPRQTCTKQFHKVGSNVPNPPAPKYLTVASLVLQGNQYKLTGVGEIAIETDGERMNWQEHLQESDAGKTWKIQISISGSTDLIKEAIDMGQAITVSDSSFQHDSGVAAWIIEGKTNGNWIIGTCLSPSSDDRHSSFHSELAGIYATIFKISMIYKVLTEKPKL